MKMAKASDADMEMAIELCAAMEAIERQSFPEGAEDNDSPDDFNIHDDEHCGRALRKIHEILRNGSIGRVIWGMGVLLDPDNEMVDPTARTLEHHPNTLSALKDAERYRLARRGQHWSVVNGAGETLRGEGLDQEIDAVLATQETKSARGVE